jgi:hypothetical protein
MAFYPFEHDTIHNVADGNDQDHDGDHGAHVAEVAIHHKNLAEPQTQVEHLGGDPRWLATKQA